MVSASIRADVVCALDAGFRIHFGRHAMTLTGLPRGRRFRKRMPLRPAAEGITSYVNANGLSRHDAGFSRLTDERPVRLVHGPIEE